MKLTERQKAIMEYIREYIQEYTMPPTIREITEEFGFKSPKATQDHLKSLHNKGYIIKEDGIARGIKIVHKNFLPKSKDAGIPILGAVAAGSTILAEENLDGYFSLKDLYGKSKDLFALRIRGDSMIYANINDGDVVIVRKAKSLNNGEIGVVIINGEATVKKFMFRKNKIKLIPENSNYEPIEVIPGKDDFKIAGKVVGVHRVIK
ncbi:MAG: repressor LexA [Planctomycetota bacterium]|nr:MAG: repressor LexA [Planctomycetota bacterium]